MTDYRCWSCCLWFRFVYVIAMMKYIGFCFRNVADVFHCIAWNWITNFTTGNISIQIIKILSIWLCKVPKIYAVLTQTYFGSSAILVADTCISYPVWSRFFFPLPTILSCCIEGSSVTTHHFVSCCSIDMRWDVRNNFQ